VPATEVERGHAAGRRPRRQWPLHA
jgi:hypothetical protein